MNFKTIIFFTALLVCNFQLVAQRGYSSASVSMNRANGVFHPDQVIIEEYMNYHTHSIPMPANGEDVALSVNYANSAYNTVLVQVGIATNQLLDYSELPPVNVCLVIDRSGSMQSDHKLQKVKYALIKFIQGLRPIDHVSIVAYESNVQVILEPLLVEEIHNLDNIIDGIRCGGSTNLHAGLMMGYEQVQKNYNPRFTNKVILLTDGRANEGVTDHEKIVEESYEFNKMGIDVATIGVGSDLNYSLLQEIARKGRGDNHFVGYAEEDIVKVFEDELEGLLSMVGRQVYLELDYPSGANLAKVYGYAPLYGSNKVRIPLNNINRGLTQVLLFEFDFPENLDAIPVTARLTYQSPVMNNEEISVTKQAEVKNNSDNGLRGELLKSYYIARMASALREMATEVEKNEFEKGIFVLDNALREVENAFPHLKDKDLIRVKNILEENYCELYAFYEAYQNAQQETFLTW